MRGPELEMRRLAVRMGMGEVTDWTGWSGGDGSGKAWRDARTAFLPLIGEPPGEVI